MGHILTKLRRMGGRAPGRLTGIITHVTTTEPVVALTFDDGPHPVFTPALLDILEHHGARATFFMLGEHAERHRDVVRRVNAAGHVIGNHSWDHSIFPLVSGRRQRAQLRACARAIAPYGDQLFRPPHGYFNVASQLNVLWQGYTAINWSVDADDWCSVDADRILEQLLKQTRPGSIVLLHDGLCEAPDERLLDRRSMLIAVDRFLQRVAGAFRFVTVPELLRCGHAERQAVAWFKDPALSQTTSLECPTPQSWASDRALRSHRE